MAEVEMPQLGETVTEGTITKWFKQVGEQVAMDEPLFEVSTEKVDSEVPSPVAGYLVEIRVPEGDTVDVGTIIAVLGDAPGDSGPADSAPAPGAAAPDTEVPAAAPAPAAAPEPPQPPAPAPSEPPPAPSEFAPPPAPAPAAAPAPVPPSTGTATGASALVSPVVRKLIEQNDLDVGQITGSGVGGRITRADVEQIIAQGGSRVARAPSAAPGAAASSTPPALVTQRPAPRSGTGDTVEPLNNIRRRTGEHMVMSMTVSPHAVTAISVDYENVERVRRRHKQSFKEIEGFSLTYLPFIARAVIDALQAFPHMNASMGDGELIVHNYVNLSIAVDLNFKGLLAPVMHNADDMRLRAIARSINDLSTRARTKKLSADDITNGTFTISNSGSFGTHMVIPIINQPQVAILSTDGVSRQPVVVEDIDGNEAISIHSVGLLAMSWDHRAFDGAYAAAFVHEIKEIIETRDWEAEIG